MLDYNEWLYQHGYIDDNEYARNEYEMYKAQQGHRDYVYSSTAEPSYLPPRKEEITTFIDGWLVNCGALKFDSEAISFVRKATPYFPYEGKLYRGLWKPYIRVVRKGVKERIDSYCRTQKGIRKLEMLFGLAFGTVAVNDPKDIQTYTPEEFINENQHLEWNPFDRIDEREAKGLDLVKMAKFVGYRKDFLEKFGSCRRSSSH